MFMKCREKVVPAARAPTPYFKAVRDFGPIAFNFSASAQRERPVCADILFVCLGAEAHSVVFVWASVPV